MKLSEKAIETHILMWLRINNIFSWKNQSVGIFDPVKKVYRKPVSCFQINGTADILGIINGKFLAIEVKSEKGRVSPEQQDFIKKIKDNGGIAFVARSVEDVEIELTRLGYIPLARSS